MKIRTFIKIDDLDSEGKVIREGENIECHSLVQAFLAAFNVLFTNTANIPLVKDITNTNRTLNAGQGYFFFNGLINDNTIGIVCGTDNTAVAVTDYKLGAQIANGVGAGQLQHAAVGFPDVYVVAAPDAYCTIRRTFTNNSGGLITVEEFGLYGKSGNSFCFDRTLQTKAIANTNGITVTYTIKITV